ncbi:MAG: pitrilysin family protein [bacterium]
MKQKIRSCIFPNGSRLIAEEMPYLKSSITGLFVKMGSDYEPSHLNGISHMLEHMIFKGTQNRDAKEIALEIESLGGVFNAYTARDHTCFYFMSLPGVTSGIFDIFRDILFRPLIPEDQLEREKTVILEELKSSDDDPQDVVFQNLNEMIFEDTQYAKTILGTRDTIRSITRDDILEFMHNFYTNKNIFTTYAGPAEFSEVKKMVKFKNNNAEHTPRVKHFKRIKKQTGRRHYTYKPSLSQFHAAMGLQGVRYAHRDKYPLLVLSTILGSGMSSRLFRSLREDAGYVYEVFSFVEAFFDSGVLGLYFICDPRNYHKALELIEKEFNEMQKGNISDEEIRKAKTQIISSSTLSFDTMTGRLRSIARSVMYHDKIKRYSTRINAIKSVTKNDLQRVARKYLDYDEYNIALAGGKRKFRDYG